MGLCGEGTGGESRHGWPFPTGKNPTDEYLEGMMSEAPGPINFTMFLTMFGEKLNGTDPEDVIRNAFACFDEEASGQSAASGQRPGWGWGCTPRLDTLRMQVAPSCAGTSGRPSASKGQDRDHLSTCFCHLNDKSCFLVLSPPKAKLKQPTSRKPSHFLALLLAQRTGFCF